MPRILELFSFLWHEIRVLLERSVVPEYFPNDWRMDKLTSKSKSFTFSLEKCRYDSPFKHF